MTKIAIELNSDLAQKVEKLVDSYTNKNILFEQIIESQKDKIRQEINEIDKDLKKYEAKYTMSSENFYDKFEKGEAGDSHDFMIWAGIYEMQLKRKIKLEKIL